MVNIKVFQGLCPQNPHQGPALDLLWGAYIAPPDPPNEIATCFTYMMFALRTFSAAQKGFLYHPLLQQTLVSSVSMLFLPKYIYCSKIT